LFAHPVDAEALVGVDEPPRVGVARRAQHAAGGAGLDHGAVAEDVDGVADLRDDGEAVAKGA